MLIKCAICHNFPWRSGLAWLMWRFLTASTALIVASGCAANHAYPDKSSWVNEPEAGRHFAPWPQRVGPAYPDDPLRSIGRDAKEFSAIFVDNTAAMAQNRESLLLLTLAGAAGIALQGPNADDPIASHYRRGGSQFNSFWDTVGDAGGNPGTHFALAGAMYFSSLTRADTKTYESGKTLLHALAFNGVVTAALKAAARTEAPNGNENVWPSGHTSSSFTLATVLWRQYGPGLGLPLAAFAAYVGYERIDAGNHNFSDVVSGALIGIAVGYSVAQKDRLRIGEFTVAPYLQPASAGIGLALVKQW